MIKKQVDNPKWGDPRDYDFTVTRTEEKGKTTYSVTNAPKEALDPGILQLYKDTPLNMAALYEGGDPFAEPEQHVDSDEVEKGLREEEATA